MSQPHSLAYTLYSIAPSKQQGVWTKIIDIDLNDSPWTGGVCHRIILPCIASSSASVLTWCAVDGRFYHDVLVFLLILQFEWCDRIEISVMVTIFHCVASFVYLPEHLYSPSHPVFVEHFFFSFFL